MNDQIATPLLESLFSKPRITRYAINPRGASASTAYLHNLQLAESIMPCLHVLEVALRNAIHEQLKRKYGRADWWQAAATISARDAADISNATYKIRAKSHTVTADRIVSELSFGFWISLLNVRHEAELWKELRLAFPRRPKTQRKRALLSKALNAVRDIRNRAAHHDTLLWLRPDLHSTYLVCLEIIGWLEPQLKTWLSSFDRFPQVWSHWLACPRAQRMSS